MSLPRAIAVGVLCSLLGCGCAATPETASRPGTYVVRPQDTLYGIAWRHNLDYRELAKWNHIGSDYKLAVGQVLLLQPPAGQPAASSARAPLAAPPKAASSAPRVAKQRPPADATPGAPNTVEPGVPGGWVWPTDRVSAPRPVPGGGILLLGQLGQEVRAASAGRVVYTGNGIRGYGNLIIVKHGDTLLSSYAHNRDLVVHEGQDVAAGQVIGHMGTGPHQISALYFEIRVNGKPVDPLKYLAAPR